MAGTSAGGRGRPVGPPSGKARAGRAPVSRPAASTRPRPGSAGRAEGTRGGIRAGSGRPLWVLGAVGVVLALLILPYFQKWLIQRSEIESARAAVAQSQKDVAGLETQRDRWLDDEYVKAQARARLDYVMPGDTAYRVADSPPDPALPSDPSTQAAEVPVGDRPWFSEVWLSAQVAADPAGATGSTGGTGAGDRVATP